MKKGQLKLAASAPVSEGEASDPTGAKITAEIMLITPALAREWLEKRFSNQRRISKPRVDSHCRAIKAGRWRTTHQGVAFNSAGELVDGQHRLAAIVESDTAVHMMVAWGVDGVEAIDTDLRIRSTADGRKMRGDDVIRCNSRWIAVVKAIYQIETDDYTSVIGLGEADELEENYAEELAWLRSYFSRVYPAPVFAALAFAYPVNRERVDEFAQKIVRMEGLEPLSAALAFVRWHQGANYNSAGSANKRAIAIRSLSAIQRHIENQPCKKIMVNSTVLDWFLDRRG